MKTIIPPIPEIDYQMVMDALKGYAFPRKKLSDMLSHGDLIRVKKGIYIQSGPGIPAYSHEILANMIYGPSYVSFHYALAYHGLIPERVEEITSATTGKNKLIDTPVGRFSYKHLGFDYFSFGFSRKTVDNQRGFLIADPEKAITDRVIIEKGRFSLVSMKEFLFDNLRIEPDDFRKLSLGIFEEAARRSGKKSMNVLFMLKKGMT